MTNNELIELYKASSNFKNNSPRAKIVNGLILDFIQEIELNYPEKSVQALAIIVRNKLRYGMSRQDSWYLYFAMRMAATRLKYTDTVFDEGAIYELMNLYPNEFGFNALDKIVDSYFAEKEKKEDRLIDFREQFVINKPSTTGSEESNDTLNKSLISSKYSKYIIIGAVALFFLLILRK